ncbi:MAG: hypothetical protein ACOX4M_00475 [Acetivibrionales bacterium]|jgi:hypothetical protein
MKEEIKIKDKAVTEPAGTMPKVGAMQHMQAVPGILPAKDIKDTFPVQAEANVLPVQPGPSGVMPSMAGQAPIICCPYLMNMQCPMMHSQFPMNMGMMNNMMFPGVGPMPGNIGPVTGNMGMMPGVGNTGMNMLPETGMMPSSVNNPYFPMGGMY